MSLYRPTRAIYQTLKTQSSGPSSYLRSLHASSTRYAKPSPIPEIDPATLNDPKVHEFLGKVSQHQGCIAAMKNLKEIFDKKGYTISEKPSMIQMGKMALDTDLRGAFTSLVTEINAAGVNMDLKEVAEMLAKIRAVKE